ncbi:MAG: membrane-bound lytic murein transglycosylase MltF, partial [Desulfobacteraceae bacterium]|nr:membrane-bound lytic murein transglycosylase MltF [Desulfobacteraceae bacterium]
MKKFFSNYFIFITLLSLCTLFISIAYFIHHKKIGADLTSIERIKKTGKLRLITNKSLSTYYYYNGLPTGFEYDLASAFAKYLGVELDIITPGWNNMFVYLQKGKGDVIAAGLSITEKRLEAANFSMPYMTIQQRLIHHKLIFGAKNLDDLSKRIIHVRRGTSYHSRLEKIKKKGIDFKYILHDNIPTEDLISMVNDREIKFTVADSNIAFLNRRHFPNIRIGIPLQEKESLAWAIRKNDDLLLQEMNKFFIYAHEKGILKNIYDKYYGNIKDFDYYELKKFHERIRTRLPKYKRLIMKESQKFGFDWRLMAAVVYQESHFNPGAKSHTNVKGLMQVTTITAEEMGIYNRLHPEQSIQAGIRYLAKMYDKFEHITDEYQRILFALASYNVGYGHVLDALKLAKNKGLDTEKWFALKETLPLLAKPKYYKKADHGYARGWEPVHYVERIL